jgi:Transglutaminase-like superfamily
MGVMQRHPRRGSVTGFLTCSEHVRSANLGHATMILDCCTGQVNVLLGSTHQLWLALAHTCDVQAAAYTAGVHPERANELVQRLRTDGLLEVTVTSRQWPVTRVAVTAASWGTQEVPAALPSSRPLPPGHLALVAAALVAVLLVRHVGRRRRSFARMITLLRAATRWPGRCAARQAVDEALHCVRQMAYVLPWRIACLEESVAAMLVLAVIGQSVVWCHGVATDPIRLHAWLTVNGVPVAEPASTVRYTPLLQIPDAGWASGRKETG